MAKAAHTTQWTMKVIALTPAAPTMTWWPSDPSDSRAARIGVRSIGVEPSALLERLGLVPEEEVAELLGVTVKTLQNRPRSDLPEFVKAGRRRLFKLHSLREYLEARTVSG